MGATPQGLGFRVPVIVTTRDNRDYVTGILYSYVPLLQGEGST